MIGTCRLCLSVNSELRNSHIISEFNYAPCYDDKHRFFELSRDAPKKKRFVQKGYRERLLCEVCETKLSKWERYAKNIIHDGGLQLISKGNRGFTLGGADYAKFKLYGMSILWRMGISSLGMFEVVNLGHHEEILRDSLYRSDPLEADQYPFFLTAVTINGKFNFDLIVPPNLARMDGHHYYRTVMSGIIYYFIVGSHRVEPSLQDMVLSKEGEFKIPVEAIENIPFLLDQMLQITEAVLNAEQGESPKP